MARWPADRSPSQTMALASSTVEKGDADLVTHPAEELALGDGREKTVPIE